MKVCFETFGCRLNRAEALEEEAKYLARGWTRVETHADADLIVVRGCSVTARAQSECERLIAHIRRKYPFKRVIVAGCLENRTGGYVVRAPAGGPGGAEAPVPTRTARAYLKVQDGCSCGCTFCIVPKFRGRPVSVPFEDVLAKARRFIEAGYHEIVVTGCNLSLYSSEGRRLPDLVAALAELTPEDPASRDRCRIRLGSVEPTSVADDTVAAVAEHANACRFLHMPVQSGSNMVLTAMRRPYFAKDVDRILSLAEGKMPGLGLGCDIMTGFPGETDLDFAATTGLLRRHRFSNAHVFPFSARPGTKAEALPDQITRELRALRADEVSAIVQAAREKFARSFVGREVEVVVEGEKEICGWTGEYLWCKATNILPKVRRKDIVRVRVLEARGDRLSGVAF